MKCFRMARDRFKDGFVHDLKLNLILDKVKDGRIYNMPQVSELVALIESDVDTT